MDITIPYYEDNSRISNSSIGWFLNKGPSYFHKMLTGEIEGEKSAAMDRGSMIHEYILQPGEFQKHYLVWDKSRPSSPQQEKFCQALAFSTEIEPNRAILSAFKDAYSTAGRSEDKMLSEGLKIASTLKDYIDFLKANDGRIMISHWDYKMLEKIKQNIQSHKLAKLLLYPKGDWKILAHEFHINWVYYIEMAAGINCKSLLDSLLLDPVNKIATIMDLKTTQKLWHFEDSIDQYDYLRQLAFYKQAVLWYLKNEMNEDPNVWTFEFYIIGIDTTGSYEIRVFKIEPFIVQSRNNVIHDAMRDILWHQSTGKWDHSRSYYEGDGAESLNL